MKVLSAAKRSQVVAAPVEGPSINATCRMTGVVKHTVLKLLRDLGCARAEYHNQNGRTLKVRRVQCDEIWSVVYAKAKNVAPDKMLAGDVWTWTAIDADTNKLIVSYMLGDRGAATAKDFIGDLSSRLVIRIQLTTDGHRVYAEAVEGAFGADVDYATLVKLYGAGEVG